MSEAPPLPPPAAPEGATAVEATPTKGFTCANCGTVNERDYWTMQRG